MRKSIISASLVLLSSLVLTPVANAEPAYAFQAPLPAGSGCYWGSDYNNGGPLTLYKNYGKRNKTGKTSSKAIGKIPAGATFTREYCPTQGWVRASYGGKTGWIYRMW